MRGRRGLVVLVLLCWHVQAFPQQPACRVSPAVVPQARAASAVWCPIWRHEGMHSERTLGLSARLEHPTGRERLSSSIKGFFPFPQGINGPISWLFKDIHQAIWVSTTAGECRLELDFMTEGGQAHPVWWDESIQWRVLLGQDIHGEVRIRCRRGACPSGSKLERVQEAAAAYDSRMNLYTNNCRIFCARMRREVQRLDDEDATDAGAMQRRHAADALLALSVAEARLLPLLYPISMLAVCWGGVGAFDGLK